jgi:hypothetical protein
LLFANPVQRGKMAAKAAAVEMAAEMAAVETAARQATAKRNKLTAARTFKKDNREETAFENTSCLTAAHQNYLFCAR